MVRRSEKRKRLTYLIPFFILIVVSIILIISFKGVLYLTGKHDEIDLTDKAIISYVKGDVLMRYFGEDNWRKVKNEDEYLIGNNLKTNGNAKASLYFGGNVTVRLNENSELQYDDEKTNREEKTVLLKLNKGEIWVREDKNIHVQIDTEKFKVQILQPDSVISVDYFSTNAVYVHKGLVKVYLTDQKEILQNVEVKKGEQIIVGKKTNGYYALSLMEDSYKQTLWYAWNLAEDNKSIIAEEKEKFDQLKLAEEAISPQIKIIDPEEKIIETINTKIRITGIATLDTEKVIVTAYTVFGKDEYTLKKYIPGEKWVYTADINLKNLGAGENRYEFKAMKKDGTESAITEVIVKVLAD